MESVLLAGCHYVWPNLVSGTELATDYICSDLVYIYRKSSCQVVH